MMVAIPTRVHYIATPRPSFINIHVPYPRILAMLLGVQKTGENRRASQQIGVADKFLLTLNAN